VVGLTTDQPSIVPIFRPPPGPAGFGGSRLLAPATLTVINTSFTEEHARARAFGAWSASGGVGWDGRRGVASQDGRVRARASAR